MRRLREITFRQVVAALVTTLVTTLVTAGGARGDVVIILKGDQAGERVEGEVTVRNETVTVRPRRGRSRRFKLGEVRVLRTSTNLVDRFLADPSGKDLLILASRAGVRMNLEIAEKLAGRVKVLPDPLAGAEKLLDKLKGTPLPGLAHLIELAEAEKLLERLKLTPKHTAEKVEKNVAAFEKEFGVKRHKSEHYFVLTNFGRRLTSVPPAYAHRIGARMDGIFREYENRLVFKEKIKDRFVVKVYSNRMEYLNAGAPPSSMAYFRPAARELVGYKQVREEFTWRSLYHEGMHQFLHFHIPNPPIWFDEGLAKYFENATPMRGVRRSTAPSYKAGGKDIYQSHAVKQAAKSGTLLPLKKLIEMSHKEWQTAGQRQVSLNYSQAWAFTHFLIESGNPMLKKLWTDYFFALRDGASQKEVNEKVFGIEKPKVRWPLIERMFKIYVGRL